MQSQIWLQLGLALHVSSSSINDQCFKLCFSVSSNTDNASTHSQGTTRRYHRLFVENDPRDVESHPHVRQWDLQDVRFYMTLQPPITVGREVYPASMLEGTEEVATDDEEHQPLFWSTDDEDDLGYFDAEDHIHPGAQYDISYLEHHSHPSSPTPSLHMVSSNFSDHRNSMMDIMAMISTAFKATLCSKMSLLQPYALLRDSRHSTLDELVPNVFSPGYSTVRIVLTNIMGTYSLSMAGYFRACLPSADSPSLSVSFDQSRRHIY